MRVLRPSVLLLAAVAACAPPATTTPVPTTPSPAAGPMAAIDAAALQRDLTQFASDAFLGREAGTEGERISARFLASQAQALGLQHQGNSLEAVSYTHLTLPTN